MILASHPGRSFMIRRLEISPSLLDNKASSSSSSSRVELDLESLGSSGLDKHFNSSLPFGQVALTFFLPLAIPGRPNNNYFKSRMYSIL